MDGCRVGEIGLTSKERQNQLISEKEMDVISWIHTYGPAVLRLAYSFLGDYQQAEDVFQDVFVKAFLHKSCLEDPGQIRSWLLTVTANRCKDLRRSWWVRNVLSAKVKDPERTDPLTDECFNSAVEGEVRGYVARALDMLPTEFKITMVLYYFDGLSATDIAAVLGMSEKTVYSRLHRGRYRLKKILEKWEVTP